MKPKTAAEILPFFPAAVRNRVEELVANTKRLLGPDLAGIILYGSAVRGSFSQVTSNVDVLLVLKHDHPRHLERIGPALRIAKASARIQCMILLADEIARAADVFPLLYEDIQLHHAVLWGEDPFVDLVIHAEHRRLRIEQELRDARIRLRRFVAEDGLAGEALVEPLIRKLKRLRSPLAALLALHGKTRHDDLDRLLQGCAAHFGVDVEPLYTPARDPHTALLCLHALLDKAVHDVDTFEVAR
jgi:hypothetical protein